MAAIGGRSVVRDAGGDSRVNAGGRSNRRGARMAGLCPPAARDAVRAWGRKPAARRPLGGVASPAVLHPWRRYGRAVLPPLLAPSHGTVGRDSMALCEDAGESAVDHAPARRG